MKKLLVASLVAGLASVAAHAESNYITSASGNASAKLDFRITIPRVLFLQVGQGTISPLPANNTNVNQLDFAPTAAQVGNGTAVSSTGGDLGGGTGVTVRVLANSGNVTLNSNNTGPMTNGSTGTIGWDQISVATAALATPTNNGWTNGAIAHPAFNTTSGGGDGTAVTLSATNGVVKNEGMWTFSYLNTQTPAAGTYGTSTNKGRVTYTASAP